MSTDCVQKPLELVIGGYAFAEQRCAEVPGETSADLLVPLLEVLVRRGLTESGRLSDGGLRRVTKPQLNSHAIGDGLVPIAYSPAHSCGHSTANPGPEPGGRPGQSERDDIRALVPDRVNEIVIIKFKYLYFLNEVIVNLSVALAFIFDQLPRRAR
jgi:hypothetical protein